MRKAARAGVSGSPSTSTPLNVTRTVLHAAQQLLVGIKAAAPRYSDFWGLGCDCFAV